jgi:hypothetical protein
MTSDNCCPVDYTITEIAEDDGPYKKGCHWAEANVETASEYMKKLFYDKDYYNKISANAAASIHDGFTPEAIAKLVVKRLRETDRL